MSESITRIIQNYLLLPQHDAVLPGLVHKPDRLLRVSFILLIFFL